MQLFLNINYGKVIIDINHHEHSHVAVNMPERMSHLKFIGNIAKQDIHLVTDYYEQAPFHTTFFGASAFRFNEDCPWQFCKDNQGIYALAIGEVVFCITDDFGVPLNKEHKKTDKGHLPNNVVFLDSKRTA